MDVIKREMEQFMPWKLDVSHQHFKVFITYKKWIYKESQTNSSRKCYKNLPFMLLLIKTEPE